jgi:hypothetical protein
MYNFMYLMKAARVLADEHPYVTDRATTIHTLCDMVAL